jgi:hypothetical protein
MFLQDEIFGQDVKVDESGQAMVAANGELLLTSGPETGSQDIKLRLSTPLGTLFYDKGFGSKLHEWKNDENSLSRRMGFCAEVTRRIRLDPRVVSGSESCSILSWDEKGIQATASWMFINEPHIYNLVIEVGTNMEMVIKDVNPGQ